MSLVLALSDLPDSIALPLLKSISERNRPRDVLSFLELYGDNGPPVSVATPELRGTPLLLEPRSFSEVLRVYQALVHSKDLWPVFSSHGKPPISGKGDDGKGRFADLCRQPTTAGVVFLAALAASELGSFRMGALPTSREALAQLSLFATERVVQLARDSTERLKGVPPPPKTDAATGQTVDPCNCRVNVKFPDACYILLVGSSLLGFDDPAGVNQCRPQLAESSLRALLNWHSLDETEGCSPGFSVAHTPLARAWDEIMASAEDHVQAILHRARELSGDALGSPSSMGTCIRMVSMALRQTRGCIEILDPGRLVHEFKRYRPLSFFPFDIRFTAPVDPTDIDAAIDAGRVVSLRKEASHPPLAPSPEKSIDELLAEIEGPAGGTGAGKAGGRRKGKASRHVASPTDPGLPPAGHGTPTPSAPAESAATVAPHTGIGSMTGAPHATEPPLPSATGEVPPAPAAAPRRPANVAELRKKLARAERRGAEKDAELARMREAIDDGERSRVHVLQAARARGFQASAPLHVALRCARRELAALQAADSAARPPLPPPVDVVAAKRLLSEQYETLQAQQREIAAQLTQLQTPPPRPSLQLASLRRQVSEARARSASTREQAEAHVEAVRLQATAYAQQLRSHVAAVLESKACEAAQAESDLAARRARVASLRLRVNAAAPRLQR